MYRRYSRTRKGCVIINNDSQPNPDDLSVSLSKNVKLLSPLLYITGDYFETGYIASCPNTIKVSTLINNLLIMNDWGSLSDIHIFSILFIGYNNSSRNMTGMLFSTIRNTGQNISNHSDSYYNDVFNMIDNVFSTNTTHIIAIMFKSDVYYGTGRNMTIPIENFVASAEYKNLYKSTNDKYVCPYNKDFNYYTVIGGSNGTILSHSITFLPIIDIFNPEETDNILITRNNDTFYEYISLPDISSLIGDGFTYDEFTLRTLNF